MIRASSASLLLTLRRGSLPATGRGRLLDRRDDQGGLVGQNLEPQPALGRAPAQGEPLGSSVLLVGDGEANDPAFREGGQELVPGEMDRRTVGRRPTLELVLSTPTGDLVLQRQLLGEAGKPAFVMAAPRLGLALPAPARPMQAEALLRGRHQEQPQQPPHLRRR